MSGASELTRRVFGFWFLVFLLVFLLLGDAFSESRPMGGSSFFVIRVVDEQTGRGVPLIELKTTNGISFWTDSQGVIAFSEPGLMEQEVYFSVRGPGYEYPADGFGNRGVRLHVRAGGTAEIQVKRLNIAERLYRITGQGIYRDSLLAGLPVVPHNGSVSWNAYRRKWILIAVQQGGDSSYLGEVWYAEADTPAGPWGYAQKVVSHERYSFYNPKHHPYFDQEGGRIIYFEGTYSFTFSGSAETAVPRYDYNQVMYRLDLSDERLRLPEPVYEIHPDNGRPEYLFGSQVRAEQKEGNIAGAAFWAVSPEQAFEGLIPIYAARMEEGPIRFSKESGSGKGKPFFYAVPAGTENSNRALVPLFEYRHKAAGLFCYSVERQKGTEWEKSAEPFCFVWKNLAEKWAADWEAQPWEPW